MFCNCCGTELAEGTKFCHQCGNPTGIANNAQSIVDNDKTEILMANDENVVMANGITNQSQQINEPVAFDVQPTARLKSDKKAKKAKKTKKGKGILVLVIVLIIIIGGCSVAFWWLNRPVNKIQSALDQGDITEALSVYDSVDNEEDAEAIKEKALAYAKQSYEDFVNEVEGADYVTTKSTFDKLLGSILSGNNEMAELLKNLEIIQSSRTAYESAEKLNTQGMYAQAIEQYNLVDSKDSVYYSLAQTALSVTVDTYRNNIIDTAKALQEAGNLLEAAKTLREGLAVLENDSSISSELKVVESLVMNDEITTAIDKINSSIDEGEFNKAFDVLKNIEKSYADDSSIAEAREELVAAYKDDCAGRLEEMLLSRQIEEAISLINEMKGVLPNDSEIDDLLTEYESYKPVSLELLDVYDGNAFKALSGVEDTYGNRYSTCLRIGGSIYDTMYAEYLINKKYNTLSGKISYERGDDKKGKLCISIYSDDECVYTSPVIDDSTEPVEFTVDLTDDCHKLKIVGEHQNNQRAAVLLSGFELYNK